MQPRQDFPFLCDVKTELAPPAGSRAATGPAQVATNSYRSGWDAIWGSGDAQKRLN